MNDVLIVALLLPWLLIAAVLWLGGLLLRQHGRALLTLDQINQRLDQLNRQVLAMGQGSASAQTSLAAMGLPIGTPAPDFVLPDLDGREHTIRDFTGKPGVFLFFSTECGYCRDLAPRLGDLPANSRRLVLISRGSPEEHRALMGNAHWRAEILLEPDDAPVTQAWRVAGTPMAYLVDAEGRIASELAAGSDAVLALMQPRPNGNGHLEGALSLPLAEKERMDRERLRSAGIAVTSSRLNRSGLRAGDPAPNLTLPDLDGGKRSLSDYRGKHVVLVFSDPDCGPCQAMAPELEQIARLRGSEVQLLMISRGTPEENRRKVREHGLSFPVLLQQRWEVSQAFGTFATPVAYLLGPAGRIVAEVAVGGDAVLKLASEPLPEPASTHT